MHPCRCRVLLVMLLLMGSSPLFAAELPAVSHATMIIAHRGEHHAQPENTIAAITGAIAIGADYVEIDVRQSRDGRHLLMHDATVDRMTGGQGAVADLDWSTLQGLPVRDPARPDAPAESIPTLEAALAVCRGRIHVYLDFKAGDRARVAQLIRAADMTRQVLVYDGREAVPAWRRVAPELPLIVSPPPGSAADEGALEAFLAETPVEVLDGGWEPWSRASVRAVEAAGVRVWPDIQRAVEGADYWREVFHRGFGGVQTDHPAALIRWLAAQGRR